MCVMSTVWLATQITTPTPQLNLCRQLCLCDSGRCL
jgi:hypothetical protein